MSNDVKVFLTYIQMFKNLRLVDTYVYNMKQNNIISNHQIFFSGVILFNQLWELDSAQYIGIFKFKHTFPKYMSEKD